MAKKKGVDNGQQAKTSEIMPVRAQAAGPSEVWLPAVQATEIDRQTALASSLARAGTLALTAEEQEHLRRAFPAGYVKTRKVGNREEAYIPHIEVSQRLCDVFGVGQWCLIRLREWLDDRKDVVYGSYALVVRGVWVGDTVAGWPYYATNASTDYADALECTRGVALRRIAAKSLDCGSQCWSDEKELPVHFGQPSCQPNKPPLHPVGTNPKALNDTELANTLESLQTMAVEGIFQLQAVWNAIGKEKRIALAGELASLKATAEASDARNGRGASVPK